MGLEDGQTVPEDFSPEDFRYRMAETQVRGTVQTMFIEGAAISHDGNDIYYVVDTTKLPPDTLELYNKGRISECFTSNLGIKNTYGGELKKLYIIPPNSHKKLAYSYGDKGGLSISLVHGLDQDMPNRLDSDSLFRHSGLIAALTNMARIRVLNRELDPTKAFPKRMVNEALRELADTYGYKTRANALRILKDESADVVDAVENFLAGKEKGK